MSKAFPGIPDPIATTDSMLNVMRVMKQAIELLVGQRGNVAPNRVFVQASAPTPERAGDMWVDTVNANKLLVWDGAGWRTVTL